MLLHTSADEVEQIVSLFENDPNMADQEMCDIFEGEVNHVITALSMRFPSRAHILSKAIEAHEAGKYNLSVPVFLGQVGGIWNERGGNHTFGGKWEKTIKRSGNEFVQGIFTCRIILTLKSRSFPLFDSMSPHYASSSPLNRHLVLHGGSLDYGTKKNSFQDMAFLDYCGMVLPGLPDK